ATWLSGQFRSSRSRYLKRNFLSLGAPGDGLWPSAKLKVGGVLCGRSASILIRRINVFCLPPFDRPTAVSILTAASYRGEEDGQDRENFAGLKGVVQSVHASV